MKLTWRIVSSLHWSFCCNKLKWIGRSNRKRFVTYSHHVRCSFDLSATVSKRQSEIRSEWKPNADPNPVVTLTRLPTGAKSDCPIKRKWFLAARWVWFWRDAHVCHSESRIWKRRTSEIDACTFLPQSLRGFIPITPSHAVAVNVIWSRERLPERLSYVH